MDASNVLIYYR